MINKRERNLLAPWPVNYQSESKILKGYAGSIVLLAHSHIDNLKPNSWHPAGIILPASAFFRLAAVRRKPGFFHL